MEQITKLMLASFRDIRENGSYFLFYLLALGLGLAIAWERYGKRESRDNWMLEEAKQKLQLWPFLYGILILAVVVANPLVIGLFNKISPMERQYYKVWMLLPILFLSAYGVVCFLTLLREEKQKAVLLIGFILLIALGGNYYGYMAERKEKGQWKEERQTLHYVQEKAQGEKIRLLAADFLSEYAGIHYPQIDLVYGKDLYTPDLDLGIMDSYDSGLLGLYEAMKNPKDTIEQIAECALLYDCDFMILTEFENPPDQVGSYYLMEQIGQYLIYYGGGF